MSHIKISSLAFLFVLCNLHYVSAQSPLRFKVGVSQVFSFYDAGNPNLSYFMDDLVSTGGPGLNFSLGYEFSPAISLYIGGELVNSHLSYTENLVGVSTIEEQNHSLTLLELHLPLEAKIDLIRMPALEMYGLFGAFVRTVPLSRVEFSRLVATPSPFNYSGPAEVSIWEFTLNPKLGIGFELIKESLNLRPFLEVNYKFLSANLLYQGSTGDEFVTDQFIRNRGFLTASAGILF